DRLHARAEVGNGGIEAPAHQRGPDAVDVAAGKPGVLRAREETGEGRSAFLVRGVDADALAGEEARLHGNEMIRVFLVGHAVLAVGAALDRVGRAAAIHVLVLNEPGPAKERSELVELLALPGLGAGVMALGALDLHPEEHPAGGGSYLDGV